jgi:hypothetical protein
MDITREYIGEKLGGEDGVLAVDETGFLKQGKKSCGVKRQYSGTATRIAEPPSQELCESGIMSFGVRCASMKRNIFMQIAQFIVEILCNLPIDANGNIWYNCIVSFNTLLANISLAKIKK